MILCSSTYLYAIAPMMLRRLKDIAVSFKVFKTRRIQPKIHLPDPQRKKTQTTVSHECMYIYFPAHS